MAQDSVRSTFHGWKATAYALGLSQLKWVGERVAEVRHVRVGGGGVGRKSMGLTPWEQLWVMLAAVAFFHTSEFLLALAFHGRRRVNAACKACSSFHFSFVNFFLDWCSIVALCESRDSSLR
jgi:hypothetical protein